MPDQWVIPLLAALGGGLAVWLAGQHIRRRAALGTRRLQRLRVLGFDEPEAGSEPPRRSWAIGRRLRLRFREVALLEEQLEQALVTATYSLRAGLSLVQALEVAWEEADQPFRDDLEAVLAEYRVGRSLDQSLQEWSRRRRSEDLQFFARALAIHRDSGGDLGLVLSNLAETIRERRLLRLDLKAKTSEARLTAAVLIAMVPLLGAYLAAVHPTMLSPLWQHPLGRLGSTYAVASWLAGAALVQRLVQLPPGGGG